MKIKNKQFKIALVQYAIAPDFKTNLQKVFSILKKLQNKKLDTIVLPEMWLGGPKKTNERETWIEIYKNALIALQAFAANTQVELYFSQLEKNGSHFYNTGYLINKNGKIAGRYRKIHLFSLGGEKKIFSAGKNAKPFESSMGKIACVVCYDIRFPELIRHLAHKGAQALFVCAQWPQARTHHWLTLLTARAIENQFYVIATNRLGTKDGLSYQGDSVVISPWGETLLHLKKNQEWGIVKIELGEVERIRAQYPFFKERKMRRTNL